MSGELEIKEMGLGTFGCQHSVYERLRVKNK
jgi:hypothetical protein